MSKLLSIGCDPEVFVTRMGQVVPVCGLLGGTKEHPLPVLKGAIQEDNVMAEFNIDTAKSIDEWVFNIHTVLAQLNLRLFDQGCGYMIKASHNFDEGALLEAGRQAMRFGCEPDLNTWTRQRQHPKPVGGLRTCGGHIHVGHDGGKKETQEIIKRMDFFLGIPSLIMDEDTERRTMYGSAGSFRFKSYGFEYRSLSNFWLRSEAHMKWAYEQTKRAVETEVDVPPSVKDVIDNNDLASAYAMAIEYGLETV